MNNKLLSLILLLLILASTSSNAQQQGEWDMPLTAEDSIIQQELEWAEKAMENYKRKTGSMPLRSSIQAAHVHTEEWRREAIRMLSKGSEDFEKELTTRNLRGSGI
jgi:hypothetical protein